MTSRGKGCLAVLDAVQALREPGVDVERHGIVREASHGRFIVNVESQQMLIEGKRPGATSGVVEKVCWMMRVPE